MSIEIQHTGVRFRLLILGIGVMMAAGLLIHRLHELQVKEGEKYAKSLRRQTTMALLLSPARGGIYDRNGIGLAENQASMDIDVYLKEMVGEYARNSGNQLPRTPVPWSPERQVVDVPYILDSMANGMLQDLGLNPQFTEEDILRHYDQKPNIPFPLARNLEFSTLSKFAEQSVSVPGVQETARPTRRYNFGALGGHIIGFVGDIEEQIEGVYIETVGKQGLEKAFDPYLQGTPGGKILRKNNLGYIMSVEAVQEPQIGKSVYVTLDARIQHIVESAMREHRVGRGACVIMEPQTGDILAMVSVPNFDPNIFIPSVPADEWKRLNADPTNPLHHRALSGYAAGSTFKTIVALAALANPDANFTPSTRIVSNAGFFHVNRWWKDWYAGGRGAINLATAMEWSVNTFFYQLSLRTGIESIVEMAKKIGVGERLLVDETGQPLLPTEDPGVMPGPQWMEDREDARFAAWKKKKEEDPKFRYPRTWRAGWTDGHTLNTSIGQGFVSVTPLQMCNMISAVANGGQIMQPRLVLAITEEKDAERTAIREFPVRIRGQLGIQENYMRELQKGLRLVVVSGTAQRAKTDAFELAGKTGTAQFWSTINGRRRKDNRAWFTGYGPHDDPRYAVAIVVEGGNSGGGTTGPIIKTIFEKIAEMEKGSSLDLVYLTPAAGHFGGTQSSSAGEATTTQEVDAEQRPRDSGGRRSFWDFIFGRRR